MPPQLPSRSSTKPSRHPHRLLQPPSAPVPELSPFTSSSTSPTTPNYCICHGPEYGFMIACDACDAWFHGRCVRIRASASSRIDQFFCPGCGGGPTGRVTWKEGVEGDAEGDLDDDDDDDGEEDEEEEEGDAKEEAQEEEDPTPRGRPLRRRAGGVPASASVLAPAPAPNRATAPARNPRLPELPSDLEIRKHERDRKDQDAMLRWDERRRVWEKTATEWGRELSPFPVLSTSSNSEEEGEEEVEEGGSVGAVGLGSGSGSVVSGASKRKLEWMRQRRRVRRDGGGGRGDRVGLRGGGGGLDFEMGGLDDGVGIGYGAGEVRAGGKGEDVEMGGVVEGGENEDRDRVPGERQFGRTMRMTNGEMTENELLVRDRIWAILGLGG